MMSWVRSSSNARAGISFWDAMIVHSAATLGCEILYSEDLNAGQSYDGVRVVNPFIDDDRCSGVTR